MVYETGFAVAQMMQFLRKYEYRAYCTLPHVIELMQVDFEKLFTVLRTESEIETYISPFISAIATNSLEQLEGQLDAAKIGIARLSLPPLYFYLEMILSDINGRDTIIHHVEKIKTELMNVYISRCQ